MNIIDYIKGNRSGKIAHELEKKSMRDPFMYEAIEGFDSVQDDHLVRIKGIERRLNLKPKVSDKSNRYHRMWQISAAAVAAVVIFAIAGYLYNVEYKNELYSDNLVHHENDEVIKIYVPEEYYTENITIIAKYNAESIKAHKLGNNITVSESQKGSDFDIDLRKETPRVLDIYLPE